MRILVTGGAGFIGSSIVDAYVAARHHVSVVDDLSSGARENLNPRALWHELDVRNEALDHVVASERPEIVSHHAAHVSVRRSVDDPVGDASVNVLGSLRLLEAARRHGVRRVIFASTGGAIYGEPDVVPADETHPCRPQSPYAVAKLTVEHYLRYFRTTYGLEVVILRYANVYGPRQDPHGEAGVVAIFIQKILAGRSPIIYGDGEQTRDFVHVADVVRANLAALDLALDGPEPAIFNVATGQGTSVNQLWTALAGIARPAVPPRHEPAKAGDLSRSVLDPARAKRVLGWQPTVDLAEGLRLTWDWFVARERKRAA